MASQTDSSSPRRVLLIDGSYLAFRAFYAFKAINFFTPQGQPTNAVFGFMRILFSLISKEQPTHVAVAFDVSRESFRTELFPDYKMQRAAPPEDLIAQIPMIKSFLAACSIVCIEKPGFEADDLIATLATEAEQAGDTVLIHTGDRDYFQLISESVTVLFPKHDQKDLKRYTPDTFVDEYGVMPSQYPDLAALRGDTSDNLPGVKGVGKVTATRWINEYGTLDELISRADEITTRVGAALRDSINAVRLNRTLTEMVRTVDMDTGLDDIAIRQASHSGIMRACDEMNFGATIRKSIVAAIPTDTDDTLDETSVEDRIDATVDETSSLADWLRERTDVPVVVVGWGASEPARGDIEHIVLLDSEYSAFVRTMEDLTPEDEKALAEWCESDSPKLLHDAKANYHRLRSRGIVLGGVVHDTVQAAYLLWPGLRAYTIEDVYERTFQQQLPSLGEKDQLTPAQRVQQMLIEAQGVLQLAETLTRALQEQSLWELYQDVELPLITVIGEMEHVGIAVDLVALEDQRDEMTIQVEQEERSARELAENPDLNVNSPKQLQYVLFEKLALPKTKKTKTGYSTASAEIEELAKSHPHPFLDHLLAQRELQKLKTTLDGLINAVGDDGRIHTTFNQTAATTGRLSSTAPNLQNIPVRTAVGRKIRSAFVPSSDCVGLITADYSQIEMRVMAHVSGDEGLIEAYMHGEDLHNYVGSKVFGVGIDEVTPDLRRKVKAMSYGLAYGLSAYGLAGQLGITPREASRIMKSYFERFGAVKEYLERVVEEARDLGYTQTMYGRRRHLPELNSSNRMMRQNAERAALNAPIQGTAADIIKIAMLRVDRAMKARNMKSRLLLQVHDELVVEVVDGEVEAIRQILADEMGAAATLRVPLEVSAGYGANWDDAAH